MEPDTAGIFARRMAFITANGLPWEQDPLYNREKRMLEAQARDEALEAQIRKDQAAVPASGRQGRKAREQLDTATAIFREMDMRFWLEQAAGETAALG